MNAPRPERIRIRFSKFGRIRFISHRDVARVWERSLRRTRLPVSYSEGYSPRPRLRFGLALATAHESCGEYLDVDLVPGTEVDVSTLGDDVNPTLPPGIGVEAVAHVPAGTPSLQEAVESCSWLLEVENLDPRRAGEVVEQVLSATELPVTRERKGKQVTVISAQIRIEPSMPASRPAPAITSTRSGIAVALDTMARAWSFNSSRSKARLPGCCERRSRVLRTARATSLLRCGFLRSTMNLSAVCERINAITVSIYASIQSRPQASSE
jgi:radical SAM-linked protein